MATIAGAVIELGGGYRVVQGTITADLQQLYGSATWNAGGVTFTALMVEITDTASAAASLLANLKVGGNSKFKIDKAGAVTITSASAAALALGLNGATNPAFLVDASTASSATGLKVKSAAAGAGVAVSVITSGTNENLTLDAAGSGTITVGGTSTGDLILTRLVRLSNAIATSGAAGDLILPNAKAIRGANAAASATATLIQRLSSDRIQIGENSIGIQLGTATNALGGGAAPTFGTIGGSGPTVAAQNAWIPLYDGSGGAFWVPIWR